MRHALLVPIAVSLPLLIVTPIRFARAAVAPAEGTIIGVFDPSSIVFMGNVLNYPAVGQLSYYDNTGTAVSSVSNATSASSPVSTLTWGTNTPSGPDTFSQLTFTGASVPADPSQPFEIGQINFLNGTSALNSLIFGATLDFYENAVTPGDYLGADQVIISTTSNQYSGTGLTLAELQTDADYINICGNDSNICGSSLEAYEDSEGGTGVTANLTGTIVGDPQLILQSITVAPGQDPATSGIVGTLPPLAVPEPASAAMLLAGIGGLFGLRGRGRRTR